MPAPREFLQGEFTRTLDERFRLSIPQELVDALAAHGSDYVLVKERAGCLSLWPQAGWQERLKSAVDLLQAKMKAGKLEGKLAEVQSLGRMLSTRHKEVQVAGRGRLLIPEGFREFLQVAPGGEVAIVGAAVCVEIWNPVAWRNHLEAQLPGFQQLFDQLTS
ncbi:MAG TPA: division/cell wall cluster transcriptional repressor MraZ [Pirellulales bacterium]|jgi:MraZ protein|nr:division/cell wall cluster transcriptional repressor MraZ [Pirellulales bacterium]